MKQEHKHLTPNSKEKFLDDVFKFKMSHEKCLKSFEIVPKKQSVDNSNGERLPPGASAGFSLESARETNEFENFIHLPQIKTNMCDLKIDLKSEIDE